MAIDFKVISAGPVKGGSPMVVIDALTTGAIQGQWVNLPGSVETLEVLADPKQHKEPLIGIVDIKGKAKGKFEFETDFAAVRNQARLQLRLTDKSGRSASRKALVDVFAHHQSLMVPMTAGPNREVEFDSMEILAGRSNGIYESPLQFWFNGLRPLDPHVGGYGFALVFGRMEINMGLLNSVSAGAGKHNFHRECGMDDINDWFMGKAIGKGVRMDVILREHKSNEDGYAVGMVAETRIPITFGDFKRIASTGHHYHYQAQIQVKGKK